MIIEVSALARLDIDGKVLRGSDEWTASCCNCLLAVSHRLRLTVVLGNRRKEQRHSGDQAAQTRCRGLKML
jgi:hypothetical protein